MSKRKRSWAGGQSRRWPVADASHDELPTTLHQSALSSGLSSRQNAAPSGALANVQNDNHSNAASIPAVSEISQACADPDRAPLFVSRKATACAECRKQKIKCEILDEDPSCTRCRRRGLVCVFDRSLNKLLEDSKVTNVLRADILCLHQTLARVCDHFNLDKPPALLSTKSSARLRQDFSAAQSETEHDNDACEVSPPASPRGVQAPIDSMLEAAKRSTPGSAEMMHAATPKQTDIMHDLIGKGIVSASVAEALVTYYFDHLDHYIYGIAGSYKDVASLRRASPILLASICTVSALHEPGPDQTLFVACNREFRRLVSRSLFEKRDVEYIRALCIASFWLSDASRIFSTEAIRRAADIRLHRFFNHAVGRSETTHRPNTTSSLLHTEIDDRTRLWYLLFVCDQHISIIHNRDSLLRSDKEITVDLNAFLERGRHHDSDVRIVSQVALLLIMGQIRDTMDNSLDVQLPVTMHGQLSLYTRQLDRWFNKFSALFRQNPNIGDFPHKGLQLHYQFGKLYLGQYVFKGLHGEPVATIFVSDAVMAHEAASTIFEMILQDAELQGALTGTPQYFTVMIAFAGHFLLEVCKSYCEQLSLSLEADLGLISKVLDIFEKMPCIPQHPILRMTSSLSQKLFKCAASMNVSLPFHQVSHSLDHGPLPESQFATKSTAYTQWQDNFQLPVSDLGSGDFWMPDYSEFHFPDMTSNFLPYETLLGTAEPYSST